MPRKARPWLRKGRGWYVQIGGRQHFLLTSAHSFEEATNALEARHGAIVSGDIIPTSTLDRAVVSFLERNSGRVSPLRLQIYRICLQIQLSPQFRGRTVGSLGADEIEKWASHFPWSQSTLRERLGMVGTFLRWCGCPVKLARPPGESRGAGVVLSDEQFARVLAAYDPRRGGDLRELLTVLRLTGARPGEVVGLTVAGVDWTLGLAHLSHHKNARRGKMRVVYFPGPARAILEAQRLRYGSGPLFRTRAGLAYTSKKVSKLMLVLSKRVGFRAIAYGERHGFITRGLAKGVSADQLAALVGNSAEVIRRNYSHIGADATLLRGLAERVVG